MLARLITLALVVAVTGCSKAETPARQPAIVNVAANASAPAVVDVADDGGEAQPNGLNPAELAYVVEQSGTTYVVLSATPDHEHWAKGAPSLVTDDVPVVTRTEVDSNALPKSIKRLVGRKMRLHGAKGEVCQGTLGEPILLGRVIPHFGERGRWDGEEIDGVKQPAIPHEQVAQIAWDMASDGKLLVSELVETNGDCHDARIARSSDLPVLDVAEGHRASARMTTQAMVELRKLGSFAQTQEAYRGWSQAQPNQAWTEDGETIISVSEYAYGGATYVWLSATAGAVCDGFSAQFGVLWKSTETNSKRLKFELVYQGDTEFHPQILVHRPGESFPNFVGRESMMRRDSQGYSVEELHVPFLDCPC